MQTLKKVRAHLNPALEIEGLLRTMYDPRNTLALNVTAELEQHFGDKLFRTDHPAQRPARRGAVARHSGAEARAAIEGRACVPRARRRDAAPRWKRRRATGVATARGRRRRPHDPTQGTRPRPRRAARRQPTRTRRDASALQTIAIDRMRPGKYQPRTRMDDAALAELAESIREQGVMQPILVRPVDGGRFEIIAGERRWRAAQRAGLREVPALVKSVPDNAALALALIENIQREDLNPLEEAQGLTRLIDEFGLTHDAAAKAVGRSRSAVTQPAAADAARQAGAGLPAERRARDGTCARAARAAGRAAGGAAARVVNGSCRCAKPSGWSARCINPAQARGAPSRASARDADTVRLETSSPRSSARRCASKPAARAPGAS